MLVSITLVVVGGTVVDCPGTVVVVAGTVVVVVSWTVTVLGPVGVLLSQATTTAPSKSPNSVTLRMARLASLHEQSFDLERPVEPDHWRELIVDTLIEQRNEGTD